MTAARRRREQSVPFFRSIQAKYALTYLLVVAAILIVMNTYPILMAENMVFTSKQSNLKRQALVIGSTLAVSETLTREGVEQTMALLEEAQGTRVLVTDATARILYDSSTLDNRLGGYALMGEVAAALRGKDVSRSEYREGAIRSRAAVPILYHGMTLGAVYLYEYDSEQAGVLRSIQANLRYISIVICLVALVLVVLLSKTLTRNTVRLLSAIRHVREGEYSHRVESQGRDEMAQLADEFNQLTGRLQTTEEARRRFVSDASHELKTPLTVILSNAELLSALPLEERPARWTDNILSESQQMKRLVEEMLTLARADNLAQSAVLAEVSLSDVAEDCALAFEPVAFEAGKPLEYHVAEGVTVLGDGDKLRRLVSILLDNAVKYGAEWGTITLALERTERQARLMVSNPGEPIPTEQLGRLFERFYRADASRGEKSGFGLGLSIAAVIAQEHKGVLKAESGREGTRFLFTLPLKK